MIITKNNLPYACGIIIGIIIDYLWIFDIYRTSLNSLDLEPDKAINYSRLHIIIRLLTIVVVSFIASFINNKVIPGLFIGLLGLKISTYLYGVISIRKDKNQ